MPYNKRQILENVLTQSHAGKWKLIQRRKYYVNVLHGQCPFEVQSPRCRTLSHGKCNFM